MRTALGIVLLLLMVSGCMALILDAKQRKLDRRVAGVMPETDVAATLSIRRQQESSSKWQIARLLFDYNPGVVYDVLPPRYVFGLGVAIVPVICYANTFLNFPFVYGLLAGLVAAAVAIRCLFSWQKQRFSNQLFQQLPDVVELVTSTVRAGLPVVAAFHVIAKETSEPTKSQFSIVCSEINHGLSPDEAIENVSRRTHVKEYRMFAVTLAVQAKAGGSMADTLQTLGDTVRQRVGLAGRARALAGEVIFSARALSVSPVVIGGLLYLVSHESIDMLFTDPTGRLLLAYAVTSVLCGTLVIRWMVRRGTSL